MLKCEAYVPNGDSVNGDSWTGPEDWCPREDTAEDHECPQCLVRVVDSRFREVGNASLGYVSQHVIGVRRHNHNHPIGSGTA